METILCNALSFLTLTIGSQNQKEFSVNKSELKYKT